MSLRYQIHLRILLSLLLALTLGGAMLIMQARESVDNEVKSSMQLALQLINLNLAKKSNSRFSDINGLKEIISLKETQNLSIEILKPSGQPLHFANFPLPQHSQVPTWFSWIVAKSYPPMNYTLVTSEHKSLQIKIRANAQDEISEAWQETRVFLAMILLLSIGLFLMIHLMFQQVLTIVENILGNLTEIETENYQNPLPEFSITEFNHIAQAINHLTATLHDAQQENNRLTLHSLQVQEQQRQTLAQELHDELGQALTAIKVMAVTGQKMPVNHSDVYQRIIEVCEHLMKVVRSMMKNLHPLVLTELGLTAALDDLIAHWNMRALRLKISLSCDAEVDKIEAKTAIQIFRIVQEGITNAVRHAQARSLQIKLLIDCTSAHGKNLHVIIADDGIGCDVNFLHSGYGLLGMEARVKSLKGSLQFISAKNQGLKIKLTIPL